MKSLQSRFNKFKTSNPNLGYYIVISRAVQGQKFSKKIISRWFNRLVPDDVYESGDKKYLIDELVKISNTH